MKGPIESISFGGHSTYNDANWTGIPRYLISQQMTLFFEAGETPSIAVFGTKVTVGVAVSGYLVDVAQ